MGERDPEKEDVLKALYHTGGEVDVLSSGWPGRKQSSQGGVEGALKMKEEVQGSNTKSFSVEM